MSNVISIEEAQAHLKDWIAKLSPGDQLIITDKNRPVAEVRLPQPPSRPQFGIAAGMIADYVDDDEHLQDFSDYMP